MTSDFFSPPSSHESLYAFVMRQAAQASRSRLLLLLAGAAGGVVLAAVAAHRWPFVALSGGALSASVITVALWGLGAHVVERNPTRLGVWAERGLVGLGTLFSFVAGMALLLAILGQPWQL